MLLILNSISGFLFATFNRTESTTELSKRADAMGQADAIDRLLFFPRSAR
jgi:hypothetical protein